MPRVVSGGLFVCPGSGEHRERVLDDYELIFVRSGELSMVEDGRELTVGRGSALLLWPGRTHRGLAPYPPDLSFYWVHFLVPDAEARACGAGDARPTPSDPVTVPQRVTVTHPEQLVASFDRLLHALASEEDRGLEASLVLSLVLVDLNRAVAAAGDGPSLAHRRSVVRKVDEYVASHLHEPISTRDIARALGYNADYLSRVYHAGAGETITDGIHRRRVAEARLLLTQTTRTVEQIAYASGYSDPGYFRRIFRRYTGSSPKGFRDLYYRARINTV